MTSTPKEAPKGPKKPDIKDKAAPKIQAKRKTTAKAKTPKAKPSNATPARRGRPPKPEIKTKHPWQIKRKGPSDSYTEQIGDFLCEELASGRPLKAICRVARSKDSTFPAESTVRRWITIPNHPFPARYEAARLAGYMTMADEVLEIADDGSNDWMEYHDKDGESLGWKLNGEHVQRSRLRADVRKWLLAKALPKIFGEQVMNRHTGPDGDAIMIEIKPQPLPADDLADLVARFGAPLKAIQGGKS